MTTYTFQEVKYSSQKSGHCAVCGKPASRSQKFFQTLNPYNRNADGSIKNRDDIRRELNEEIAKWRLVPVKHAKCEAA